MAVKVARFGAAVLITSALACGSDPVSPPVDWDAWPYGRVALPAGVTLGATVSNQAGDPDIAQVQVTATNTGASSAVMTYNDCAFGVRVYRGSTATGDPVYHNERTPETQCITITRQLTLAPGGTAIVPLPARGISLSALRASIGSGTFTMTVTYRTQLDGPVIDIPAGELTL